VSLLKICLLLLIISLGINKMYAQQPMREFFGVNVFKCQEAPEDIQKVAQWIRDYARWEWIEPVNNQYRFRQAVGGMDYDAYYQQLHALDIHSLFVVMKSPEWISAGKEAEDPSVYAPSGAEDGLQPEHYREAAEFYYQLAARYGKQRIEEKYLLTDDKRTGLGWMDVIEADNEPDGVWGNKMSLEQYAALLNAVYDGNEGAMQGNYGVKAADPDMPVSIGGLAGNLEPLKKIVAYAGRAPFDIINVHFYAFRHIRENFRVAVPPEWSSLEEDMREIVAWRDQHAPGRPVWLTEIGWDTKDYSTEYVSEQEAANYLIRSYLLALGAGVEKCFWFIFRDLDDDHGQKSTVFSSSGLFENESIPYAGATHLQPKLTYWYNATFKQLVSPYHFEENASYPEGDSTIYHYKFFTDDGKKSLSVLWYSPQFQYEWRPLDTRPGKVPYQYFLPAGNWKVDKVVKPVAGTTEGAPHPFTQFENSIQLSLDGTPVFIISEKND